MLPHQGGREVREYFSKEENIDLEVENKSAMQSVGNPLKGENNDCKDSGAGTGKGLCLEFGGMGLEKWGQIQQVCQGVWISISEQGKSMRGS